MGKYIYYKILGYYNENKKMDDQNKVFVEYMMSILKSRKHDLQEHYRLVIPGQMIKNGYKIIKYRFYSVLSNSIFKTY